MTRGRQYAKLDADQSVDRGREARSTSPRSAHGDWKPAEDRPDPASILAAQAATRVQELVPIRYGRMLVSPFTFYRGAAAVMAADLADTPDSGIAVQACGDAHISNFGGFAAPDRRLLFDLNDFDETLPGPWEWDVKRMAASAEIAGRDASIAPERRAEIVTAAVRAYREAMHEYAGMGNLDVAYSRIDVDALVAMFGDDVDEKTRRRFGKALEKAHAKTSVRAVKKLTEEVDGKVRFRSVPPLLVPMRDMAGSIEGDEMEFMEGVLGKYVENLAPDRAFLFERYRFVDMARKVVGVGSVGTRAWVLLFMGRDAGDPLMLQAKEAQPSVLEPYVGQSEYSQHGERVVHGQRMMQAASDILLSWLRTRGADGEMHDFYVRQLWDMKASAELSRMDEKNLTDYCRACSRALARAHSSSGNGPAIATYLGSGSKFDRAIARFSAAYADQNDRDYHRLVSAAESGEVPVEYGV